MDKMSSEEDINGGDSPSADSPANSKDNGLLDPKPQPKVIRVLTVLAYILSVSMAAILLSIYYIFMWDGEPHIGARRGYNLGELQDSSTTASKTVRLPDGLKYTSSTVEEDSTLLEWSFANVTAASSEVFNSEVSSDFSQREDVSVACQLLKALLSLQKAKAKMSSHKPPLNNGLSVDSQWTKANSLDTGVKLAGEEAKDRLYEPKHKKKLVRVLTVIAYIFFVSLAAIMLSIYYVFLWNGDQKMAPKYASQQQQVQAQKCDNIVAEMQQQQLTNTQEEDLTRASTTTPATTEENTTWPDYDSSSDFEVSKSTFFKKLMFSKYPYAEND